MADQKTVRGVCSHCKGKFKFPWDMMGVEVLCPHCKEPTLLEVYNHPKASGEKAPPAPQSDTSKPNAEPGPDQTTLETEESKATLVSDDPKAIDALKEGLADLAKAVSITAKQSAVKADPKKHRNRLMAVGTFGLVAVMAWAFYYQVWKSDLDRQTMWAERGNANAQYQLARLLGKGEGVEKDLSKAVEWSSKAAEQDHVEAQLDLGSAYENRVGVGRDFKKAYEWYLKAAEQGSEEGQHNVGRMHYHGRGCKKDYKAAYDWFVKSKSLGDSQCIIGRMYDHGHHVDKDIQEAITWWRKGAAQDHPESIFNLGSCYHNGDGIKRDFDKAKDYFEQASDLGYAEADVWLGYICAFGEKEAQDPARAFKHLTKAYEAGSADGTCYLGVCYLDGIGVAKDKRKGLALVQESVSDGSKDGRKALQAYQQQQVMSVFGGMFSDMLFDDLSEDSAARSRAMTEEAYNNRYIFK